ncbi:MAG: DUF4097 family beta strand repeat protein [Lachnospiraceae bacterium]|nr:DUF4097 family beta strand repeat protein [Lachnospiraceae bacterium]
MQESNRFTEEILGLLTGDDAIACDKPGLNISTADSAVYVLCDARFSEARIYRAVPIAKRETKGGLYLHSNPEDPTFSETFTKVLNETVSPETVRREKEHVREMAADLKTPEGRRRFGREFLSEIADLDIRKMAGNAGALFYSRQRENLQKHITENSPIFVGLPIGFRSLEIRSESGDIEIYLGPGEGRAKTLSYLNVRTIHGDIAVTGIKADDSRAPRIQDMTLETTKADCLVSDLFAHYIASRTLSGDCELNDIQCDDLAVSALRSGDVDLKRVKGKKLSIIKKSGDVTLEAVAVKALSAELDRGDMSAVRVSADRMRVTATRGDIDLTIEGDTKAVIKNGRGDIKIDLENGYKGFTAKIDGRMHGGAALETKVAYGRYIKTFTGDCKIACNEKKTSFEITGGDELTITGSIPRREENGT